MPAVRTRTGTGSRNRTSADRFSARLETERKAVGAFEDGTERLAILTFHFFKESCHGEESEVSKSESESEPSNRRNGRSLGGCGGTNTIKGDPEKDEWERCWMTSAPRRPFKLVVSVSCDLEKPRHTKDNTFVRQFAYKEPPEEK